MDNLITLICGVIQLVFVLWFTFSVVEKLKRSERLLRELLRTANPNHPDFVTPATQAESQSGVEIFLLREKHCTHGLFCVISAVSDTAYSR
jgi:hypothetical protein